MHLILPALLDRLPTLAFPVMGKEVMDFLGNDDIKPLAWIGAAVRATVAEDIMEAAIFLSSSALCFFSS
ncbi:hypothetical protein NA971_23530, partial [Salmonella sp. NW189]|uniref:hypothetical protein n=1 Tax=Salmonella sp. NW189 TaxID=2947787 RepID=UPI003F42F043